MPKLQLEDAVERLTNQSSGYCPDAYYLVNNALNHTLARLGPPGEKQRHVDGRELCHGFREYVLSEYGLMSPTMLEAWGIRTTRDVGAIVFQLIAIGYYAQSPSDRIEDFESVYDFYTAFEKPFHPKAAAARDEPAR
jgi:uncharacterized repeat protein (TIGR04138 family)